MQLSRPILLVEDDPDIRDVLSAFLLDEGYAVVTARNGLDALRALADARVPPGLILLDMMMAEMSGKDFLKRLAEDHLDTWARIRVIVITAGREPPPLDLPYPVEHLNKPLDLDALLSKIRGCYGFDALAARSSGKCPS